MKGTRITKTILKRLNKLGELTLSDFKTYYKSVGRYINIELVYINIILLYNKYILVQN